MQFSDYLFFENDTTTQEVRIWFSNIGSSPATNMTLIVESLHPILEAFTDSSTVEISSTNIEDSRYIEDSRFTARIPILNQGGGAYIAVYLNVSISDSDMNGSIFVVSGSGLFSESFSEAYSVYAIYNEGSTGKFFPLTAFEKFQEIYGVFGSISLIIVYVLIAVFFLIFFIHRVRRGRVKTFISKLLENITEIRRALRSNNNNKEVFRNDWKLDESQKQDIQQNKSQKRYTQYIQQRATLDYILLDDFYTKLDERNQSLKNIIPQKLENLNENLLQLADNALQKIDWEKYTS